jgi:hypothetical protein
MAERADIDGEIVDEMAAKGEHPYAMIKRPEADWVDPGVQAAAQAARARLARTEAMSNQQPFADTDR